MLHFRRQALRPLELRDKKIEVNDKVIMWHISANRDEEVFEDPFRFDIERTPNDHIAFGGGGAHFCLGANLARMELRLIFDEINERLGDMQLAGEPERLRSNFIGGIKHMPVTFTPGPRRHAGPTPAARIVQRVGIPPASGSIRRRVRTTDRNRHRPSSSRR